MAGDGLHRVDPATGAVTTLEPHTRFFGVVLAYGSVCAVSGGEVVRVDADTYDVVARIGPVQGASGVAAGAGSIWLADGNFEDPSVVTRIDPATNSVVTEIQVPSPTRRLIVTDTAVYATVYQEGPGGQAGGIYGIDATTNQYSGQVTGGGWQGIALVGGSVWVVGPGGTTAVVTDRGTIEAISVPPVELPSTGDAIAYGAAAVWAPSPSPGYLLRIDPGPYD